MKQLLYEGCELSGAIVNWVSSSGRAESFKARPPIRVWLRQKLNRPKAYDIKVRYEVSGVQRYDSKTGNPIIEWFPAEFTWDRIVAPRVGANGREQVITRDNGGFEPTELVGVNHKGDPVYVHEWIAREESVGYAYSGGSFTSDGREFGIIRPGGVEMTEIDRLYTDFYEAITGWNYDSKEEDNLPSKFQLLVETKRSNSWWKVFSKDFRTPPSEVSVKCGQCKSKECQEIYSNDLTKFTCGCPSSDADGGFVIEDPK